MLSEKDGRSIPAGFPQSWKVVGKKLSWKLKKINSHGKFMEFVRVATLDSNVHGKELLQIIFVPENHHFLFHLQTKEATIKRIYNRNKECLYQTIGK